MMSRKCQADNPVPRLNIIKRGLELPPGGQQLPNLQANLSPHFVMNSIGRELEVIELGYSSFFRARVVVHLIAMINEIILQ